MYHYTATFSSPIPLGYDPETVSLRMTLAGGQVAQLPIYSFACAARTPGESGQAALANAASGSTMAGGVGTQYVILAEYGVDPFPIAETPSRAKKLGVNQYARTKPCSKGHTHSPFHTSSGACVACTKIRTAAHAIGEVSETGKHLIWDMLDNHDSIARGDAQRALTTRANAIAADPAMANASQRDIYHALRDILPADVVTSYDVRLSEDVEIQPERYSTRKSATPVPAEVASAPLVAPAPLPAPTPPAAVPPPTAGVAAGLETIIAPAPPPPHPSPSHDADSEAP